MIRVCSRISYHCNYNETCLRQPPMSLVLTDPFREVVSVQMYCRLQCFSVVLVHFWARGAEGREVVREACAVTILDRLHCILYYIIVYNW